jgi:hypothetical protein
MDNNSGGIHRISEISSILLTIVHIYTNPCVELYSKYIMIMHRTIKLPIKEGNGIAKHDQHVAVAFQ